MLCKLKNNYTREENNIDDRDDKNLAIKKKKETGDEQKLSENEGSKWAKMMERANLGGLILLMSLANSSSISSNFSNISGNFHFPQLIHRKQKILSGEK